MMRRKEGDLGHHSGKARGLIFRELSVCQAPGYTVHLHYLFPNSARPVRSFLIYRCRNWGSERLSKVLRISQLLCGIRIQSQVCLAPNPFFIMLCGVLILSFVKWWVPIPMFLSISNSQRYNKNMKWSHANKWASKWIRRSFFPEDL